MHPLRKLILDHAEYAIQAMNVSGDYSNTRNDAGESAILSRKLEAVRASALEVRYPELKGRRFVPLAQGIDTGAEVRRYTWFDEVAQAEVIRDYSKDLKRADVLAGEATTPMFSIANSYGFSIQEMRASAMAGANLDGRKARAARNAIERKIDDLLLIGDSTLSINGLFTLTGTNTLTPATGFGGDTLWTNKTADEILDDMFSAEQKVATDSNEIDVPNRMLLSVDRDALISRKRMGDGSTMTVKQYFLTNSKYVKNIDTSIKLASNTGWTGHRMVVYKYDLDTVEGIVSQEFEQFPPQWRGLESITPCHARCGGVVVYFPKAVLYCDNI